LLDAGWTFGQRKTEIFTCERFKNGGKQSRVEFTDVRNTYCSRSFEDLIGHGVVNVQK
jgi:hypothetical protein